MGGEGSKGSKQTIIILPHPPISPSPHLPIPHTPHTFDAPCPMPNSHFQYNSLHF
ncbi:MAG: hypothetical protein RMY29_014290 [Nostoc sp. CreGUA01]